MLSFFFGGGGQWKGFKKFYRFDVPDAFFDKFDEFKCK